MVVSLTDTSFSDSYILTDAILETWIGSDPRTAAVALKAASAATQEWYCQRATRIIDMLPFQGYKLVSSQERAFPRKYSPSYPISWSPWGAIVVEDAYGCIYMSSSVPQDIIDACCEEAIALYDHYSKPDKIERLDLQRQGVSSVSYGGTSEQYATNPGGDMSSAGNRYHGLISKEAFELLQKYIEFSVCVV